MPFSAKMCIRDRSLDIPADAADIIFIRAHRAAVNTAIDREAVFASGVAPGDPADPVPAMNLAKVDTVLHNGGAVSYTHLDVYKRQRLRAREMSMSWVPIIICVFSG